MTTAVDLMFAGSALIALLAASGGYARQQIRNALAGPKALEGPTDPEWRECLRAAWLELEASMTEVDVACDPPAWVKATAEIPASPGGIVTVNRRMSRREAERLKRIFEAGAVRQGSPTVLTDRVAINPAPPSPAQSECLMCAAPLRVGCECRECERRRQFQEAKRAAETAAERLALAHDRLAESTRAATTGFSVYNDHPTVASGMVAPSSGGDRRERGRLRESLDAQMAASLRVPPPALGHSMGPLAVGVARSSRKAEAASEEAAGQEYPFGPL